VVRFLSCRISGLQENTMTQLKAVAIALALLGTAATQGDAQFCDPAAFQAQYPNRDVLNGGALTQEGAAVAGPTNSRVVYGAPRWIHNSNRQHPPR
jgi:hypothetical protein